MHWKTFPLRVERNDHITPSIIEVAFRRDDGEPFEYRAGQFVNIHFESDGKPVHRSYSIATPPGPDGRVEIAVSPVTGGLATDLLFNLRAGDVVQGSGPYGRFVLRDDEPCHYVMAATGTGVTPFRAMLPELEARLARPGCSIDLLLGVWHPDELLYGAEFLAFAERNERFRFHACFSRHVPDPPLPWQHHGYVQQHFGELDLDAASDIIYLCGNPGMIDEAMELLKASGFPTRNLRREKYLPSKT